MTRTGVFEVISKGMMNRSVELIKARCTALEGSTLEQFCDGVLIRTEIRAAKNGSKVRKQCLKSLNKPKTGSLSQRRLHNDFIKCKIMLHFMLTITLTFKVLEASFTLEISRSAKEQVP